VRISDQLNLLIGLCTFILVLLLWPEKKRVGQKKAAANDRRHHSWHYEPRHLIFFRKFKNWYPDENRHEAKEREYWSWQRGIAVLTFISAVGALYIAISAFRETQRQVRAAIEANKISRESFTSVQRAFVTVATFDMSVRIGPRPSDGSQIKYWWFTPNIKNSGNTPTKNMNYLAIASCAPTPAGLGAKQIMYCEAAGFREPSDPADILGKPQIRSGTAIVGPQATVPVGGVGVTEDFIKALENGIPWFLYGIIQYNDIFPNSPTHVTKFCYQIIANISDKGELFPTYNFCTHWNCADDDCDDDRKAWEADVAAGRMAITGLPTITITPIEKSK
jgi:hypothetical protein